jgi:hypothetical protein
VEKGDVYDGYGFLRKSQNHYIAKSKIEINHNNLRRLRFFSSLRSLRYFASLRETTASEASKPLSIAKHTSKARMYIHQRK